jgi:hypothetical protein
VIYMKARTDDRASRSRFPLKLSSADDAFLKLQDDPVTETVRPA